jgi:hypothetical protein
MQVAKAEAVCVRAMQPQKSTVLPAVPKCHAPPSASFSSRSGRNCCMRTLPGSRASSVRAIFRASTNRDAFIAAMNDFSSCESQAQARGSHAGALFAQDPRPRGPQPFTSGTRCFRALSNVAVAVDDIAAEFWALGGRAKDRIRRARDQPPPRNVGAGANARGQGPTKCSHLNLDRANLERPRDVRQK